MSTLTYQEKSLYGTLAADLLVFVPYFIYLLRVPATLTHIMGTIVLLIVAQLALQAGIAIFSRNRITDERDRQVAGIGYRNAYFALVGMILVGMGMLWVHAALGQLNPNRMGLHFLSVFLGMVVLSELVKVGTQLVAYRRSI